MKGALLQAIARTVVIENKHSMATLSSEVHYLVIKGCNDIKGEFVISGLGHISHIRILDKSLQNVDHFAINDCALLKQLYFEQNALLDDRGKMSKILQKQKRYDLPLENVKSVTLSSALSLFAHE